MVQRLKNLNYFSVKYVCNYAFDMEVWRIWTRIRYKSELIFTCCINIFPKKKTAQEY